MLILQNVAVDQHVGIRHLFHFGAFGLDYPDDATAHFGFDEDVEGGWTGTDDGSGGLPVVDDDVAEGTSSLSAKSVRLQRIGRPVNRDDFNMPTFPGEG